jgi:hypothetical protein
VLPHPAHPWGGRTDVQVPRLRSELDVPSTKSKCDSACKKGPRVGVSVRLRPPVRDVRRRVEVHLLG